MKLFLKKTFLSLMTILSTYTTHAHSVTLIAPKNVDAIEQAVKTAATNKTNVTIKGAGKGVSVKNTLCDTTVIDLQGLNKILNLDISSKTITVQAGISWKEIQEYINPFGLAVAAMQSYCDFSVGGSIGVNAHGQDFRYAPVGSTVISMVIINAQGEKVTLSPTKNAELYHAVIGGYGLFGIITEVTLQLIDNTMLKKRVKVVNTKRHLDSLTQKTLANNNIALFSARFTIGSENFFDTMLTLTYHDTKKITTEKLKPLSSIKTYISQKLFGFLRDVPFVKNVRLFVEKHLIELEVTKSRNNFMHFATDHLQETRSTHIDILQEYFIPLKDFKKFVDKAKVILQKNNVNLLNGTLRLVKKDTTSFLSYAPETCSALVLFISLENSKAAFEVAQLWTRELINAALECHGTFYLPYQCFATKEQVHAAYPQFDEFIKLKRQYDPQEIFVNDLYLNYK